MFSDVINIKVVNTGGTAGSWTGFSFNRGGASPQGGASITVNSSPNSMEFASRESQQRPYVAKKIKIKVTDVTQFGNAVTITGTVGSRVETVNIEPLDYYNPNTGIDGLIEIDLPDFVIDGSFGVSGTINPGVTMNIVIDYDYLKTPSYPGKTYSQLTEEGECHNDGSQMPEFRYFTAQERIEIMNKLASGRIDTANPKT